MLKSDHFGIEIVKQLHLIRRLVMLKSDHFGIEITDFLLGLGDWQIVKIRPFWD